MNTMNLIDTHSHIYAEQFQDDRAAVMQRIRNAGIEKVYMPNIDGDSIPAMMEMEKNYPDLCVPMMGLHPCHVTQNYRDQLAEVENWLNSRPFVAVGEIGIDLYWDTSLQEEQTIAFREQINLAKSHNLPIVIHCRNSYHEIVQVLEEENDEKLWGIFHCFTGTAEEGQRVIELGFYLGIGGIVTFKNAGLNEEVAQLPLDKLVLETDSPYLAPHPKRGKRNESGFLPYIAEKIAEVHNTPVERVAEVTTANANKIFSRGHG